MKRKEPLGFKQVSKGFFDGAYGYLLDVESLHRTPTWNDVECSVKWNDVHGNPCLLIVEADGIKWYVSKGYMKHVFSKGVL